MFERASRHRHREQSQQAGSHHYQRGGGKTAKQPRLKTSQRDGVFEEVGQRGCAFHAGQRILLLNGGNGLGEQGAGGPSPPASFVPSGATTMFAADSQCRQGGTEQKAQRKQHSRGYAHGPFLTPDLLEELNLLPGVLTLVGRGREPERPAIQLQELCVGTGAHVVTLLTLCADDRQRARPRPTPPCDWSLRRLFADPTR